MRRIFFFIIPIIALVLLCFNCAVPEPKPDDDNDDKKTSPIAATGVELNKHSINIMVGESEQLVATVLPADATNQNINWGGVFPIPSTISLSENGLVMALKEGTATVWITTEDGNYKDTCKVTVLTNKVAAPVLNPQEGVYESDQSITISSSTANAEIYYTTDGSEPTNLSTKYTGPIVVSGFGSVTTIRAIAMKEGMADSEITTGEYRIDKVVSFPDVNLESAIRDKISKPSGDIYLSEVQTITSLTCDNCNITDISGIENLTSLIYLNLFKNNISDISLLAELSSLGTLFLESNDISDLSPLSELSSLKVLYLSNNNISDISSLSGLTSLTNLSLSNNNISDLTPISNLTLLVNLVLSENNIKFLSPLSGLTSLESLYLSFNNIDNINPLSELTSLTTLDLSYNDITDIFAISDITSLHSLHLFNNLITSVKALAKKDALDDGDILDVRDNPLDYYSIHTWIPEIESKGVTVTY